ncbi:CatB-related O-acetyltransferase [Rhodobacteraceae bacterium DSL-40]|uniref:CatB-related O-acetyltransferase n=1 Tax=Amaricoccus sp. B4 TaxID=3368557 RepID=UPI000DACA931
MTGPSPEALHPLADFPRVVFPRALVAGRTNVHIGEFSYYDAPAEPEAFFERNDLHHSDFLGDRLVIGRFVAIASGVRILMNGGTLAIAGFSTYPFNVFCGAWAQGFDPASHKSETVVGSDVWIGTDAVLMPGITIDPGALIAARSAVIRNVPAYALAAGNPARIVRRRFNEATVSHLLALAWWDWPVDHITAPFDAIRGADITALKKAAP